MSVGLGSAYGKIFIDFTSVKAAVDSAVKSLNTFQNQASAVGDRLKTMGNSIKGVGDDLSVGLTLPLAAIGVASGKAAMEFETSMQHIVGLAGQSQDQVNAWKDDLMKMGAEVGKSPKELADALYQISSSGIVADKALGVLNESAKAAAAGLGETSVVADVVTSALNAYQASNLTAAQATDTLVAAVREGKGDAKDFAPVLGMVIPVASQLGVSFDQVTAAIAAMTIKGAPAAEAATNLSGIMSALMKPSKQASDALAQYGLSGEQLRTMLAEPGGLLNVLNLLSVTVGQDDEALTKVFGNIRGLRGMFGLLGDNAEQVVGIFGRVKQSTGDTGKAIEAISQTMQFKFDVAISTVQSSLITFGNAVLPAVLPVLQELAATLGRVADWFRNLSPATQDTIVKVLALTAALGPILSIGGRLIATVGTLVQVFNTLGGALLNAAKFAGNFAKTAFEVVQYLVEAGAAGFAVAGAFAVVVVGIIAMIKFFDAASRAAKATNEELLKMANSDTGNWLEDQFNRAGASFEMIVNGSKRLKDVFVAHQEEMQKKLFAGEITLEDYNAEIERSAKVAGVWSTVTTITGEKIVRVDGAVKILTADQVKLAAQQEAVARGAQNQEKVYSVLDAAMGRTTNATQGVSDALQVATDKALKDAEAIQKLAEESEKAEAQLNTLKSLIAGEVGQAYDEYTNQNDDLIKKQAELRAELVKFQGTQGRAVRSQMASALTANELTAAQAKQAAIMEDLTNKTRKKNESDAEFTARMAGLQVDYDNLTTKISGASGATTSWVDNSKRIGEIKTELGNINTALDENAAAYDRRLKTVLFDMATEQLAADGLTGTELNALVTVAENFGLVDDATVTATLGVLKATSQLAEDGNAQAFGDNMQRAVGVAKSAATDAGTVYGSAAWAAEQFGTRVVTATTTMATNIKPQVDAAKTKFGEMTGTYIATATGVDTQTKKIVTSTNTVYLAMGTAGRSAPGALAPVRNEFDQTARVIADKVREIIRAIEDMIRKATGIDINIPMPGGGGSGSGGGGGGGGGTCFLPGTLITMADGRLKPIEEIGVNDVVLSFDARYGAFVEGVVTGLQQHTVSQYRLLRLVSGESVRVTGEHPIYVGDGHAAQYVHDGFVRVDDLRPGDRVRTVGGWGVVIENQAIEEPTQVYNFEVAGTHTYIAGGVVAHNVKASSTRAYGGPVYSGRSYLFNENPATRPEIIVPQTAGYALTRQDAQAALRASTPSGAAAGGAVINDTTIYNNTFQDTLATRMYLEQIRQAKLNRLIAHMIRGGANA